MLPPTLDCTNHTPWISQTYSPSLGGPYGLTQRYWGAEWRIRITLLYRLSDRVVCLGTDSGPEIREKVAMSFICPNGVMR